MLHVQQYCYNFQGNWRTQLDGRPRAGLVPKEIASLNGVSTMNNNSQH